MEKIPRLTPEQRDDLVAYLDGELPDERQKEIDHVLSRNPAVQHDVDMLARTWDLLGELPLARVSSDFTARTMSTVRLDDVPRPLIPSSWLARIPKEGLRRGAIVAAWIAILAGSAAAGYLATNRWIPDESKELLENLPVIEKLDLYSNVGSIDYLRQLDKRIGSFDEPPTTDP